MKTQTITRDNIPAQLKAAPIYLYGAGMMARTCVPLLVDRIGGGVEALIDDNPAKWGTVLDGIPIVSFEEFAKRAQGKDCVNVVVTSVYGAAVLKKLESVPNAAVWEMYGWYASTHEGKQTPFESKCEGEAMIALAAGIERVKPILEDDESRRCLDAKLAAYKTGDFAIPLDVTTSQTQYLIDKVAEHFKGRRITIVDGGAFEGELLWGMKAAALDVKKWFCFELDERNFARMGPAIKRAGLPQGIECVMENKGLWSSDGDTVISGDGNSARVSQGGNGGGIVAHLVSIDSYFKDEKVDMIKMDIEGAEMDAIKGGINVIKRDVPVLAVCIYHKVADHYRIMEYLMQEMKGRYKYYIRHHTPEMCETVLYAIPR